MSANAVARKSVRHSPRVPCDSYEYANILAISLRNRHRLGLLVDHLLDELLLLLDNLVYKVALRLRYIRGAGCSFQDSYSEVMAKLFELLVDFDPERVQKETNHSTSICVTVYIKKKLTSWVGWESMRGSRVKAEQLVIISPDSLEVVADGHQYVGEEGLPLAEVRQEMANYTEKTRDLLFLRHVLNFTQDELANIMGISQQMVGLDLKEVEDALKSKLPEEPVASCAFS